VRKSPIDDGNCESNFLADKKGIGVEIPLHHSISSKETVIMGLQIENNWKIAESTKNIFVEYLQKSNIISNGHSDIIDEYNKIVRSIRKPRIVFVGLSDAGKSTIINSLLGVQVMPTAWTPYTSIIVYVKHISDKPAFIKDDVWAFKAESNTTGFDTTKLEDEQYCTKLCVARGDVNILQQYGTRKGEYFDENIVAAVIFLDNNMLNVVELIDLPGFGTGDREADDIATNSLGQFADVLVYLSPSNGFLTETEQKALQKAIQVLPCFENIENNIPPLSNLFIISSQAHNVKPVSDLKNILDGGYARFKDILLKNKSSIEEFFKKRNETSGYNTEEYLRGRYFTYTTDIPFLRKDFEEEFKQLIEMFPHHIVTKAQEDMKTYIAVTGELFNQTLERDCLLLDEKLDMEVALKQVLAKESSRQEKNRINRNKILREIDTYKEVSLAEFRGKFSRIISVDSIVNIIENKKWEENEKDMKLLVENLISSLNIALKNTTQYNTYLPKLKASVNRYIRDFKNECTISGHNISSRPFDAKIGNVGDYSSNLQINADDMGIGDYILMTVLSPLVLVFGIFYTLFGNWRKDKAEKIVKSFEDNKILSKYEDAIHKFWMVNAKNSFNTTADAIEREWQNELKQQKIFIADIEEIENYITNTKVEKKFLSNIPV